jgi:hypothetical protein
VIIRKKPLAAWRCQQSVAPNLVLSPRREYISLRDIYSHANLIASSKSGVKPGFFLGRAVPGRIAYARGSRDLPVVLSGDEVVRFLEAGSSLKARVTLTTA